MKEILTPLQRFWGLLSLHTKEIYQIYGYAILNGFVNLSLPLGIQSIISFIQTGQITFSWALLVLFVLIGIAITGVLQVLQLRIVENIQHKIFARSAFEFAYRIPKMQLNRIDHLHAPEVVNRFFDTLTIQKGIPKILIDFSLATFQIFFGLILLAFYSPYFILLGVVLFFSVWVIIKLTGRKGLAYSLDESQAKYALAHWLEEIAANNKTFKVYSERNLHINKTDKLVVDYLKARESHFLVLLNQFKQFIGLKIFLAAGLLVAGSVLVLNAQLNIGQFVAAEIIIILIINSIEKIIKVMETIYDVLTGLEKIGAVSDIPLDESNGTYSPMMQKGFEVELINLKFSFPNNTLPIIDVNRLKFPDNKISVLTGKTGNGKTTLLKVIGGLFDPQEGEILFDEIPLANFSPEFLHQAVGFVFSTNEIFEGTIWENITMGCEVLESEVFDIIGMLHLSHFVAKQPQGIHTQLDSEGRRLPKSVIQKLLIARAVVHKPHLLLLDQPLSQVYDTEKIDIINWLSDSSHNWTIITSSNDSIWKSKADQIIEI